MTQNSFPSEDPILAWTAPQHVHVERGKIWYIVASVAVVSMAVYSILTSAWTFTVLIALLASVYWKMHKDTPDQKHIRIWKRGFAIEDDFYDWQACAGYWIAAHQNFTELHIEKSNGGGVKIQTGEINPYLIHETMTGILQELPDRREHILDTIIRICKL